MTGPDGVHEPPSDGALTDSETADDAAQTVAAPERTRRTRSRWRELPFLLIVAFFIAVLVKTFALQAFYIPSGSMEPGLQIDDRILVNKVVYRLHEPRRGDIIVIARDQDMQPRSLLEKVKGVLFEGLGVTRPGHTDFIKRVIALPGETIDIDAGVVTITPVDAEPFALDEPYAQADPTDRFGPYVVPAGTLFVMGDNRPASADSRTDLGQIERDEVVGRAFVRVWPLRRVGLLRRPAYEASPRAMLVAR